MRLTNLFLINIFFDLNSICHIKKFLFKFKTIINLNIQALKTRLQKRKSFSNEKRHPNIGIENNSHIPYLTALTSS